MARFVKCEQCSFRFRPEPSEDDGATPHSDDEPAEIRCPRCDTVHVEPEVPPKYWRLYCLVGLAAGVLVAGGMLLNSWLGSNSRLDPGATSSESRPVGTKEDLSPTVETVDNNRPKPVLPGAVAKAPIWLDSAGPFNAQDLFAPLEAERNAAPLYLDALIGFSSELAVCVPEEFREPAMSNARKRSQEFVALFRQWKTTPQSVDESALKLCLAGYGRSFDELSKAQRRPRCVFDSDLSLFSEQRHVNAAREVANVASLRILHFLRSGQSTTRKVGASETEEAPLSVVERCLADMERILRLSRDLRPRGRIETQQASLAIDQTMLELVPALVARPELTVADCDHMTKLLTRHKAESADPYVEGLRAEYLLLRALLLNLRSGTGLLPETRLANEIDDGGRQVPVVDAVSAGYLLASKAAVSDVSARAAEIDTKLQQFTAEDFETERDKLDGIWTELFKASNSPAGTRREATLAAEKKLQTDTAFLGGLSRVTELADQKTWWETTLNSLHCVLAIRRWELEHTEPPPDLLTAVRQSGLSFVPIDPFSGGPLRVSFVNAEAMIYSVGPDGVDDAGKKVVGSADSEAKGDVVFRIPYHAASSNADVQKSSESTPAGF